ncbi:MAG: DUF4292 domain-containing protein [Saprospiraceae bacterium]
MQCSKFIFLAIIVIVLSSCGASKKGTLGKLDRATPDFLLKSMVANQVNLQWLDGRAKIDFSDENTSMGATATIRIKKDSVIWVSVRKLGFEVARALVTKDSVYIIDRLNNEYDIKGLDYLQREYNLPANFESVQAILLGNPIFFTTNGLQSEAAENAYHLYGKSTNMDTHYWLDQKSLQLKQMNFKDLNDNREVNVKLEDYQPIANNQNFSYLRKLELNSRQTGNVKVDIQFSQLEINSPKDIRFEIPNKYTRSSSYDD